MHVQLHYKNYYIRCGLYLETFRMELLCWWASKSDVLVLVNLQSLLFYEKLLVKFSDGAAYYVQFDCLCSVLIPESFNLRFLHISFILVEDYGPAHY